MHAYLHQVLAGTVIFDGQDGYSKSILRPMLKYYL